MSLATSNAWGERMKIKRDPDIDDGKTGRLAG
jgi:hypothetical protein